MYPFGHLYLASFFVNISEIFLELIWIHSSFIIIERTDSPRSLWGTPITAFS